MDYKYSPQGLFRCVARGGCYRSGAARGYLGLGRYTIIYHQAEPRVDDLLKAFFDGYCSPKELVVVGTVMVGLWGKQYPQKTTRGGVGWPLRRRGPGRPLPLLLLPRPKPLPMGVGSAQCAAGVFIYHQSARVLAKMAYFYLLASFGSAFYTKSTRAPRKVLGKFKPTCTSERHAKNLFRPPSRASIPNGTAFYSKT